VLANQKPTEISLFLSWFAFNGVVLVVNIFIVRWQMTTYAKKKKGVAASL